MSTLGQLKFFRLTSGKILDIPVIVSRTGYTGDLGYELWFGAEHAAQDLGCVDGEGHAISASSRTGILALDVARLEAGFILLEVDYIGAEKAVIRSQRYSPFDIGLGWTVDLAQRSFHRRQSAAADRTETDRRAKSSAWKSISTTTNIYTNRPAWRRIIRSGRLARRRTSFQR